MENHTSLVTPSLFVDNVTIFLKRISNLLPNLSAVFQNLQDVEVTPPNFELKSGVLREYYGLLFSICDFNGLKDVHFYNYNKVAIHQLLHIQIYNPYIEKVTVSIFLLTRPY